MNFFFFKYFIQISNFFYKFDIRIKSHGLIPYEGT